MLSKQKQAGRYSRKKGKVVKLPEKALQAFVDDFLALKGVQFIRIPDRVYQTGLMQGGVPDNICVIPIKGSKFCKCLMLECKTKSQLHGKQVQAAHDQNWAIVRTPEQAMEIIQEFIDA